MQAEPETIKENRVVDSHVIVTIGAQALENITYFLHSLCDQCVCGYGTRVGPSPSLESAGPGPGRAGSPSGSFLRQCAAYRFGGVIAASAALDSAAPDRVTRLRRVFLAVG